MSVHAACLPRAPGSRNAGFSMVELMVVVFLISLAATFILLTAPPGKLPERAEAERLAGMLEQISARAVVSGQSLGLVLEEGGYVAALRTPDGWKPESGTRRKLPRDVELHDPREEDILFASRVKEDTAPAPIFAFDAQGSALPGELALEGDGETYLVRVSASGEIAVREEGGHARR